MADRGNNPFVAGLRLDDVGQVCGEIVKSWHKKILEHIKRVVQLVEVNASGRSEDERIRNLHLRLVAVESELRRLKKGRLP